jgi:hypothetical protein
MCDIRKYKIRNSESFTLHLSKDTLIEVIQNNPDKTKSNETFQKNIVGMIVKNKDGIFTEKQKHWILKKLNFCINHNPMYRDFKGDIQDFKVIES